ncbi:type II restriction endonuclease [Campylobacter insulaenigrae]|uniref:type II restriction endonuclease n=1 Tax=Campylobacter insulaenigrae TaxID=260714 RepID=UPI00215254A7|nr:type II restriction endonuclease [Campylobacter insulaenigrae]MCR6573640.1 type II restriction endonuclease [Campylobacter insulaenigrae]MCR6575227.1 type II restriction endonuclease [Campylobacter insulaenigrae]MCR6579668.1 type II restriction endonuclease [Campylobacter insulaenigrae]MCR6586358.1 type II restriction endonuclease [Campylobacter insulaenigrae]
MRISQVKTAFKIADVEFIEGSTKLNFNYLKNLKDENNNSLPQSILTENVARVYLIVVDGEIKKIGGSQDKGGIKGTLSIYKDGGVKGRPSIRSFGIWYFLYHTILQGKKIEFYMIFQENFEKDIKGLFGYHKIKNASISYKFIEECCNKDYLTFENSKYPDWNVQEQGMDWPEDIKNLHAEIQKNAQTRDKKIIRQEVKFNR